MTTLPFPVPTPPTVMAIPDFIAGLMYGLTTENHLTEIEGCWTAGTVVDEDLMIGIHDLHHGGLDWEIQAILEFGLAALNLPIALKTCEGMGPDIKAIESWATIFENPAQLTATVTKHYALHRKAIKQDIADVKSDWALGEFYKCGVQAADLLTLAVGPITVPKTLPTATRPDVVGMPVKAPYEFATGFLYGFTKDNNLGALETCYHEDATSFKFVKKAFSDLLNGDHVAAIADLAEFAKALPTDLVDCKAAKIDIIAVDQWAQIFKDRASLIATVTKHYALHRKAIKADIAAVKADWALGEFYQAGVVAADLVTIAVGPVVVPTTVGFSAMAVPDFVAGFIYGMTGDNDLTEIEACWQGSEEMYGEVEKAIADFKKGGWDNITQGCLELSLALLQFPQALNTCEGMDDDIAAIEAWGQIFTDPAKLTADVTKRWLLHKKAIKADAALTEADWKTGNYFQAGVDAAALMTLAVGPI